MNFHNSVCVLYIHPPRAHNPLIDRQTDGWIEKTQTIGKAFSGISKKFKKGEGAPPKMTKIQVFEV
jgi:hypothetical protein